MKPKVAINRRNKVEGSEGLNVRAEESREQMETKSEFMEEHTKFGIDHELYCDEECRITVVEGANRMSQALEKTTPRLQKKNSKRMHQEGEIEFCGRVQQFPKPHLIQIYEIVVDRKGVHFNMEYACGGDLAKYAAFYQNYHTTATKLENLKSVKKVLWQVVLGLEEIHGLGYVHRDIKPDNIVITHQGIVKLCDFQLVGRIGNIDSSFCGTPQYMPPERLSESRLTLPLSQSIDFWALGVLAYELMMGKTPFQFNGEADRLLNQMYEGYIDFDNEYPAYCRHLVVNLLQTNHRKRLTLQKIKAHSFFNIDFEPGEIEVDHCSCKLMGKG